MRSKTSASTIFLLTSFLVSSVFRKLARSTISLSAAFLFTPALVSYVFFNRFGGIVLPLLLFTLGAEGTFSVEEASGRGGLLTAGKDEGGVPALTLIGGSFLPASRNGGGANGGGGLFSSGTQL